MVSRTVADMPSPAVQRQWLSELVRRWHSINDERLSGRLNPPLFILDEAPSRLGYWDATQRTLGISISHLIASSWLEVELTLRHEMAHQVVSEMFDVADSPPHGVLFQRACGLLGITGSARSERSFDASEQRLIQRVRKLLNLAGGTSSHEAQAALAAANRLLLKHNLDTIDLKNDCEYGFRWVGEPKGRVPLERKVVASILQDFFFVQCIWIRTTIVQSNKSGSVLEILGQGHNLEMAAYVHDVLLAELNRLWLSYRQADPRGRKGARIRNDYRLGVLMGYREQLQAERTVSAAQGLVWVGEPGLKTFFSERHPRVHRRSGGRYRLGGVHEDGKRDGHRVRIYRAMKKSKPRSRGRLLSGR